MGDWYVIASIPYFAEKDCVDSIESYALRPDGKIDNWSDTLRAGMVG
jgi:apolipoprotein D and lipocalin family protein